MRHQSLCGKRCRGSALVTALFIAFILSLLTGATAVLVTANYSRSWAEAKQETALQLAEAGTNAELNYISSRLQSYQKPFAHGPSTMQGEPYPGNAGTVTGTRGKYWVYSTQPGTNKPWKGQGPVQITCTATVWSDDLPEGNIPAGARTVSRTVTIKATPQSVFGTFGLFGLDSAGHGNQPSVAVTGAGDITIEGRVGTNGIVQKGSGQIAYDSAYNYNGGYNFPPGAQQFTQGELNTFNEPFILPTVTELLQDTFPESGLAPWTWLQAHSDNDQIRMFSKNGPALTHSGTTKSGLNRSRILFDNTCWVGANPIPGSSSVRALILPPGDYYFSEVNLGYDKNIRLIIDNAGLTTPPGKNQDRKPVRIWINGAGTGDRIEIPMQMTDPDDASTFRVFYGKDGAKFRFRRDNAFDDSDGDLTMCGCFYAVTSRLDPLTNLPAIGGLQGTEIDLHGDSPGHGQISTIIGSVFADRIQVIGKWRIIKPGFPIGNESDPAVGIAYDADCDDQPCYSDGG